MGNPRVAGGPPTAITATPGAPRTPQVPGTVVPTPPVLGSFSGLVGILLELPGLIEAWRRLFRPASPPAASSGKPAAG